MAIRVRLAGLLVLAALTAAGGCGQKIWITQYPTFYTEDLKTVAVIPFRSGTPTRVAGQIVSDSLANALGANGTYQVYNRNDLRALMNERDIQIAFGQDTQAAATAFRKLGKVQAILTGVVTTYAATSQTQIMRLPQYATAQDGTQYIAGYTEIPVVRNEANVAVTAALVRVADGMMIYATPMPVQGKAYSEGYYSAGKDVNACLAEATREAVWLLLENFAVVRKQVTVNNDDFRTAGDFYDNTWTFTDSFRAGDEKMNVVLSLPDACDRNRFRIAIVRKDQREDLGSQDLVWSREDLSATGKKVGKGFPFSPREIAAKGGGPGNYVIKLYSGPEPVMTRPFRINP